MDIRGNDRCFCGRQCRRASRRRQGLDCIGDSLDLRTRCAKYYSDAETFFDGNWDCVDGPRWFPGFPKHPRYCGICFRICSRRLHPEYAVRRDRDGAGGPDRLEQSLLGTTFSGGCAGRRRHWGSERLAERAGAIDQAQ